MRAGQEIAEGSSADPSGCEFNPSYTYSFIYIYIYIYIYIFLLCYQVFYAVREEIKTHTHRGNREKIIEGDKRCEPEVLGLGRKQNF
jgi:hypothetical protein